MFRRRLNIQNTASCLVLGPRQTGKTTLLSGLLPESSSWSVDLLDPSTHLRYAKDPSRFRAEVEAAADGGVTDFLIDEVQRLPVLLDVVQGVLDRRPVRFLLTGSSARKLRRGGANLLGGRALVRHLHPLTRAELGPAFDLDRVLRFGTLPPMIDRPDELARQTLRSYVESYLREEIQTEALVRNLGGFARLLDIAASQSGDILNASSIGRDASLATRTVAEYFQILEDTLIGFRLEAWRRSPRSRLVAHPKFYLFDTGVTNALAQRLTAPLVGSARGRLFEQWLVLESWREIDYSQAEVTPYYWRTRQGAEVDLVLAQGQDLRLAVEIKSKAVVSGADLSGLRSFREQNPGVPCRVVSTAPNAYLLDDILVQPFGDFLEELPQLLRPFGGS